nr:hypothetical protein [Chroomonas collegionis]
MIFNLFSNITQSMEKLETLEHVYSKKVRFPTYQSYVTEPKTADPVAKFLEDVKERKIKVLIPDKRDIIPSLWNNKNIGQNVQIKINPEPIIEKPNKFPTILRNQRSPHFPTAQQKIILEKLQDIPVYTVVTKQNEVMMATARDVDYNNIVKWLYQKYYELFVWTEDDGPTSVALFFMNKEDASLYLHSMGETDTKGFEKDKLRIQATTLDYFYRISRTTPPGQQTRLIADLEEVEKVVFGHLPRKLHESHIKQAYDKTEFRGTPIYAIDLATYQNNYSPDTKESSKTCFNTYLNQIFFRVEDAYLAWDKICDENKSLKLPSRPSLEIYNLENYISDLEKSPVEGIQKIQFLPTFTSFKMKKQEPKIMFNKEQLTQFKNRHTFIMRRYEKMLDFYKGMFWVITSDSLPTEDTAW